MAVPSNRQEFKDYVLRKLGAPVIDINLSDEQIDDRIDEALYFYRDYHFDGTELVYIKHQLTQTDVDRGYVEVPVNLVGVSKIFDLSTSMSSGSGMFNVNYQFVLNNIQDIVSYDITNYYMSMQHIEFLKEILVGKPLIRYNRHSNKVYIDATKQNLEIGTYIIIEAYDILPENSDIWSDRWLQNYAAALIKENWGSILSKYTNMQLIGGVMFNGEQIYNEGKEERKTLEDEAKTGLQPLIFNFIG